MGILVDGLLALSNVARQPLDVDEVDLSAMATAALQRLVHGDPSRSAAVQVEPGLRARADRRLMAVLLDNLLGNAWKFTSATPHTEIAVGRSAHSRTEAVFHVRDNGAGFDMAHAANLFNAFERLHASDEFPGSGIGLATVQRVVKRHGGRVWAESAPRKGSCFYFALPAG